MKLEEGAKAGVYWAQRLRCFPSWGALCLHLENQVPEERVPAWDGVDSHW